MSGVYQVRNIINNKIYVGSSVNFRRRWWNHRTITNKGCRKLNAAMQKYGKDNFVFEPLQLVDVAGLSRREAQMKLWECEQIFLDKLKPFDSDGYNIMKSARNDYQQTGSHNFSHLKAVRQYALDGNYIKTYSSMKEAATENNMCDTSITDCCKKIKKSAGGYIWKKDIGPIKNITPYKTNLLKPVGQYSKEGKLLKKWKSGAMAARELKIQKGSISSCCTKVGNKYKSAGGFIWKFLRLTHVRSSRPIDERSY